jgi:hypothetical protein
MTVAASRLLAHATADDAAAADVVPRAQASSGGLAATRGLADGDVSARIAVLTAACSVALAGSCGVAHVLANGAAAVALRAAASVSWGC